MEVRVTYRSELRAGAGNGLARRTTEKAWLTFGAATGIPVHSFRLAGIYGPDRNALTITSRVRYSCMLCTFL